MRSVPPLPKLIAVVGPTASGKTDLAIAIAKKFDGEIISADSRQLYKGMDIGADVIKGKWRRGGVAERRRRVYVAQGIPHHLIAFRSPAKPLSAAEFQKMAIRKAREIIERGKLPILAGGTGLYVRMVVDNFDIPHVPPNKALRRKLERRTSKDLAAELKKKDPAYAAKISLENRRYLIRALEVIAATGRPFSELQKAGVPLFDVLQIGIRRPRKEMYERINSRIDAMMRRGLLKEAERLGKRHGWDLPTMSGLGHRQLGAFLQGKMTLEQAVERVKIDTRHYAKRQMTWLRRDRRIKWVKGKNEAFLLINKFAR